MDVAALSHGEVVVLTEAGLARWDGEGNAQAICDLGDPVPTMLEADGDRIIGLGGEPYALFAWVSDNRGASCVRIALPPLVMPRTPPGESEIALEGSIALAWSTDGAIARSDDGGRRWLRIPPLARLQRAAPGPEGSVLGAAACDDPGSTRERVCLWRLPHDAARWQPVNASTPRRLPIAFATLADGSVHVADGEGEVTLAPGSLTAQAMLDAAYIHPLDAPRVLQSAGGGRIVGFSSASILSTEGGPARVLGVLPTGRAPHAIDAAEDGTVWVADALGLWRGDASGHLQELSHAFLDRWAPELLAARLNQLAVIDRRGRLHASTDGGGHWRVRVLPLELGTPMALALDPRMGPLILGSTELAYLDRDGFSRVSLPAHGDLSSPPSITVVGDRWIYVSGGIWTSDDQGNHWTPRVATSTTADLEDRVIGLAMHDGQGYALRADGTLLRTDDGGASFAVVASVQPPPRRASGIPAPLTWDGESTLGFSAAHGGYFSHDGGASFVFTPWTEAPRMFIRLPGGHELQAVGEGVARCGQPSDTAALVMDGHLAPGACTHRGALFALDGALVYVLTPAGTLWRTSTDALTERAP